MRIELSSTGTRVFIEALEKSEAELGSAIRCLAQNNASHTCIFTKLTDMREGLDALLNCLNPTICIKDDTAVDGTV